MFRSIASTGIALALTGWLLIRWRRWYFAPRCPLCQGRQSTVGYRTVYDTQYLLAISCPILRCRTCGHTVYPPLWDNLTCRPRPHPFITQDGAILCAAHHAASSGYRVVESLEPVQWPDEVCNVKFNRIQWDEGEQATRWQSGEWAVVFDKQLPPGAPSHEPLELCVLVNGETGECATDPLP